MATWTLINYSHQVYVQMMIELLSAKALLLICWHLSRSSTAVQFSEAGFTENSVLRVWEQAAALCRKNVSKHIMYNSNNVLSRLAIKSPSGSVAGFRVAQDAMHQHAHSVHHQHRCVYAHRNHAVVYKHKVY